MYLRAVGPEGMHVCLCGVVHVIVNRSMNSQPLENDNSTRKQFIPKHKAQAINSIYHFGVIALKSHDMKRPLEWRNFIYIHILTFDLQRGASSQNAICILFDCCSLYHFHSCAPAQSPLCNSPTTKRLYEWSVDIRFVWRGMAWHFQYIHTYVNVFVYIMLYADKYLHIYWINMEFNNTHEHIYRYCIRSIWDWHHHLSCIIRLLCLYARFLTYASHIAHTHVDGYILFNQPSQCCRVNVIVIFRNYTFSMSRNDSSEEKKYKQFGQTNVSSSRIHIFVCWVSSDLTLSAVCRLATC